MKGAAIALTVALAIMLLLLAACPPIPPPKPPVNPDATATCKPVKRAIVCDGMFTEEGLACFLCDDRAQSSCYDPEDVIYCASTCVSDPRCSYYQD